MKRVISACLEQTLKFGGEDEFQIFFGRRDSRQTKYKIVEKKVQPDSTIVVKILREHSTFPVGDYLN